MSKTKFLLYTNPNNATNKAYTAIGAQEVKEILVVAKEYPGSYRILFEGKGTEEDVIAKQLIFSNYRF